MAARDARASAEGSTIRSSFDDYEAWLRARLGARLVEADLHHKHLLMRQDLFAFLRGTCWRWAETAPALCPGLMDAPSVPAVIDSHIANFGLWRDAEGRLVWGVNDYDEAAPAPWPFDLVRLAASALIAEGRGNRGAGAVETVILDGYRRGLERPRPFVLERGRAWLRSLFAVDGAGREHFWEEIFTLAPAARPDPGFVRALRGALPGKGAAPLIAVRQAGVGSLGRLRLVAAVADWRGGPAAREAKAIVPSCWNRSAEPGAGYEGASGRYRSPDPWLRVDGAVVVRRLAPNSRKIELGTAHRAVRRRLLRAMGRDLASVHASDRNAVPGVKDDLERRGFGWLAAAARAVAEATERDWKAWRDG